MILNREVTENYVIHRKIWAYLGTWQRSYKLVFIPVIYHYARRREWGGGLGPAEVKSKERWVCRWWTWQIQGWGDRRKDATRKERKRKAEGWGLAWQIMMADDEGKRNPESSCVRPWDTRNVVVLQRCSPRLMELGSPLSCPQSPQRWRSKCMFSHGSKRSHVLPSCIPITVGLIFCAI